jgi:hypothetical protein
MLLRHPLAADPGLHSRDVFVCENPSIVELAAARLAASSTDAEVRQKSLPSSRVSICTRRLACRAVSSSTIGPPPTIVGVGPSAVSKRRARGG